MARWCEIVVIYHTYRKGECLKKIAEKYGVTVEQIAKENDITNVDILIPRSKITNRG